MKRSVQILLLALFMFPLSGSAREETMEERKLRITRKYLRERTVLAQSESMVPMDGPEDEEVLDSEKFMEPQVSFERQEPGSAMPMPPPVRNPVPRPQNPNWLLAEDPELEDPYANPFAPKVEEENSSKRDWTTWAQDLERESSRSRAPRDSWYESRTMDPSAEQDNGIYDQEQRNPFSPRNSQSFPAGSLQPGYQQQDSRSPFPSENLDLSKDRVFNPTFEQRRLSNPALRGQEEPEDRTFGSGSAFKQGGYIPYKSPYQTRREQQQQGSGSRIPQQEYQQPNSFEQWKQKNPTRFDPTRDDAFIDEVMPKSGR
jgi:hypothetical protein